MDLHRGIADSLTSGRRTTIPPNFGVSLLKAHTHMGVCFLRDPLKTHVSQFCLFVCLVISLILPSFLSSFFPIAFLSLSLALSFLSLSLSLSFFFFFFSLSLSLAVSCLPAYLPAACLPACRAAGLSVCSSVHLFASANWSTGHLADYPAVSQTDNSTHYRFASQLCCFFSRFPYMRILTV